jgi:hypothetical protein
MNIFKQFYIILKAGIYLPALLNTSLAFSQRIDSLNTEQDVVSFLRKLGALPYEKADFDGIFSSYTIKY